MPRPLPHALPAQPRSLKITGGRVLGDTPDETAVRDLAIADGVFVDPGQLGADAATLDASGLTIAPGLLDIHVHLREPGGEHKETIATGAASAVAGGFTTVGAMPNTNPVSDTVERVQAVHQKAADAGLARVIQYPAVTRGQTGDRLVDIPALDAAGCVAFSDDGHPVRSPAMMAAALRQLREVGRPALIHAEELSLVKGPIHDGAVARKLGVGGIDPLAEELMTLREVFLAEATGGAVHICHVSTARAVEIIRRAKAVGAPVTAEVCPHHLLLTDEDVGDGDADFKMNPPLRTAADAEALQAGLLDGTLDAIVSDHAPHAASEKASGLVDAPFGIVGLETTLGLVLSYLVRPGVITLEEAVARMTSVPARILDLPMGRIAPGAPGDLTLIDEADEWTVDRAQLRSKSKNTPFHGWTLQGRAAATIVGGRAFASSPGGAERLGDLAIAF